MIERQWGELIIAVLGGDEREQEIVRLAAATGARVRAFGFPWPEGGIEAVELAPSPAAALSGAHYALLPIPGLGSDGSVYAPSLSAPIIPDAVLLSNLAPGATIILGTASASLRQVAMSLALRVVEYENDRELMLRRAPAIVEGAIGAAIANTELTLHDAQVGVVGYGNIGRLLARQLVALLAHVHVFARNPVQRADAFAAGCQSHSLDGLTTRAASLDVLFSTASARVVDRRVLEMLSARCLVLDLAAPPGSVDLDAASELGLRGVWARGLGRRAPVSVGRSQWIGIAARIENREKEKTHEG